MFLFVNYVGNLLSSGLGHRRVPFIVPATFLKSEIEKKIFFKVCNRNFRSQNRNIKEFLLQNSSEKSFLRPRQTRADLNHNCVSESPGCFQNILRLRVLTQAK